MARATTATGVVLDVSGQTVTVDLDSGGTDVLQKMRHVSCQVGDLAHIITVGQARFVDGVIGAGQAPASDAPITVPPPAPQDSSSGSWPFGPSEAGTWRDGLWRDDTTQLWQGALGALAPQYGAAWYGDGPSSLPGSLTSAVLTLRRVSGPDGLAAPTIALYSGQGRPDGAPVVIATDTGPGLPLDVATDWTLPTAWLALLDSGTAGGLGCYRDVAEPSLALSAEDSGMSLTCWWAD